MKPRLEIESALALCGRPLMWANEQQAAVLSGVGMDAFRRKVKGWEKRGFPAINPENDRRPVPHILAFWGLPQNHVATLGMVASAAVQGDDDDGQENWNG